MGIFNSAHDGWFAPLLSILVVAMRSADSRSDNSSTGNPTRKALAAVLVLALMSVLLSATAKAQVDSVEDEGTSEDEEPTEPEDPRRRTGDPTSAPQGQVVYITADGDVLVGIGEAVPRKIGRGAAVGANGQGAVAIAPTADVVAYVAEGGLLVFVPIAGGEVKYAAGDVSLEALGNEPILAWNATGDRLAYVANGTEEEVVPPGDRPRTLQDPLSSPVPLPDAGIGTVIRVVDKQGSGLAHIGDPSQRWMIGVHWSPADPIMLVESVVPGTDDRYTLAAAADDSVRVFPTPLSADQPDFAPDGSFIVGVGSAKGSQELLRVAMDTLELDALVLEDRICRPSISPDASRIAYGAGENCNKLMLVSSLGGQAFEVTPIDAPDTLNFDAGGPSWTADGKFITWAGCLEEAGEIDCGGPTQFLEPDSGRLLDGPEAVTIEPIRRALVQDVWLDIDLRGPLEFRHSFLINPETQAGLTEGEEDGGYITAEMSDGAVTLAMQMTADAESPFLTGTMALKDPETGIDRTFFVLGRATLLGVRVFSITGVWYSSDELPFATGEFNLAVRRR